MRYNWNPWVTHLFAPKARFLQGPLFAQFSTFSRCRNFHGLYFLIRNSYKIKTSLIRHFSSENDLLVFCLYNYDSDPFGLYSRISKDPYEVNVDHRKLASTWGKLRNISQQIPDKLREHYKLHLRCHLSSFSDDKICLKLFYKDIFIS